MQKLWKIIYTLTDPLVIQKRTLIKCYGNQRQLCTIQKILWIIWLNFNARQVLVYVHQHMQLHQCNKDNKILPMVREYIATEGVVQLTFKGSTIIALLYLIFWANQNCQSEQPNRATSYFKAPNGTCTRENPIIKTKALAFLLN